MGHIVNFAERPDLNPCKYRICSACLQIANGGTLSDQSNGRARAAYCKALRQQLRGGIFFLAGQGPGPSFRVPFIAVCLRRSVYGILTYLY